jgi:hypothetical protein
MQRRCEKFYLRYAELRAGRVAQVLRAPALASVRPKVRAPVVNDEIIMLSYHNETHTLYTIH